MDAAHRAARERGEELLAVTDQIGESASERLLARLAEDLSERRLLRDVAALDAAIRTLPDLPESLKPSRLLGAALLEWFRHALGLTLDRSAGDELEVEAASVRHFSVVGEPPESGLVRIRVLHPGWKRLGRVIAPPVVTVVDKQGEPAA